jgi:hypothetical protein
MACIVIQGFRTAEQFSGIPNVADARERARERLEQYRLLPSYCAMAWLPKNGQSS